MRSITILLSALLLTLSAPAQNQKSALEITHLTGDFYIYTTYQTYNGEKFPANGMYLLTDAGAVLFDSPWDATQFQPLLDSIQAKHNQRVIMCIATHSHEDRTAGLAFYKRQGIKTYTTKQTDSISKEQNEPRAEFLIATDTLFTVGQHAFKTYYAGPGHTPDNIVIWFPKEKIIYGGCLIKSIEARDLGNLSDANVAAWPTTIRNIQRNCKHPTYIITGHQDWTSKKSLQHTLKLLEAYKRK